MGKALYRKYRSRSLDEIVGQTHITALLKRAITNDNVAHAYLLTGPRGVGKTSIARILAHEINGLPYNDETTHLDIIEIDAASNNSVEDIRDLREKVMVAPSLAKKKIYIIDEVHMLSKSAFNALLKTLEEPPEHVVFILATTDVEKLPATIISRVQRFNFRTIASDDAVRHLRTIADAENIDISDAALELIARHGRGSFRDSISLLDQLRSLSDGTVEPELIESVLGLADADTVHALLAAYEQRDIAAVSKLVSESESRGTSPLVLADQIIQTVRRDIADKPHLLPLLDKLLEVGKSAWPNVKILTALASSVPAAQANVKPHPQSQIIEQKTTITSSAKVSKKAPRAKEVVTEAAPEKVLDIVKAATISPKQLGPDQPFPWSDFLAATKEKSTGAHSLLAKCGYHFDGNTLTIYGGKPFTKKKLDQALPHLSACLESIGVSDGVIVVLDIAAPAKDGATANILDIMGGGEEIQI